MRYCATSCHRNNEKAYVTVNGKQCWSQTFSGANGSDQCGRTSSSKEESIAVKCEAESVGGKLTVRVYADLSSSNAKDESFAIDNVVITKTSTGATALCSFAFVHVVSSCECHVFC